MSKLVVEVRFHDGRYHGVGEDFPSPARLFQALVAATSIGAAPPEEREALEWLEGLDPPTVGVPCFRPGTELTMFVPHNDADKMPVEKIRAKKTQQPWFFDADTPLLYCWDIPHEDGKHAAGVCRAALGLYQFGRGIDQAYAQAQIVDDEAADVLFVRYPGDVFEPRSGEDAKVVSVPRKGSLDSLLRRFTETTKRIQADGNGILFVQAAKARFDRVSYGGAHRWLHFDLLKEDGGFSPYPVDRAAHLVQQLRQAARSRLDAAFPEMAARWVPMKEDPPSPTSDRLRFVPLPSRGHEHTNQSIRRVSVELPSSMTSADADWLLSALAIDGARLARTSDAEMWDRYAATSTLWQTVTPVVLPVARRRLEPTTRETKGSEERQREEAEARQAVLTALRQAHVRGVPLQIDVQREPWEPRGKRVEDFAKDTRFEKERAWHVRIRFARDVAGPLVCGDGRFAGLGLMAPPLGTFGRTRTDDDDVVVLAIDAGLSEHASASGIADAFRRAIMGRMQEFLGSQSLPEWVTGHLRNGAPIRDDRRRLRVAADLGRNRLLALIPRQANNSSSSGDFLEERKELLRAIQGMDTLRAGNGGRLLLHCGDIDQHDVLFSSARRWRTTNDYLVNRHDRDGDARALIQKDVVVECQRRGLPRPDVEILSFEAVKGTGLFARIELTFAVEVSGPILLGRSRITGGGLMAALSE